MNVYDMIRIERAKQDAKWGGPEHDDEHPPEDWIEYIGDKLEKADALIGAGEPNSDAQWVARMVQIAALAVAAVESVHRHHGGPVDP